MSHEVETMFYAGEVPWHGLGEKVEKEITAAAAIRFAGLDWNLEKQPLFLKGKNMVDNIPVIGNSVPNAFAVVRPVDSRVLGVVSGAYEIIQNRECFDFMDSVIGDGQAVYHTAGSLFNGSIIFMTVKLPTDAQVGPDKIEKYLLLSSSHDGSQSLSIRWTPVRVVCANTLSAAFGDFSGEVKIRHCRNYRDKVAQARKVLELTEHYYGQIEKLFGRLLETSFSHGQMEEFTSTLFPVEGNVSKQTKNKRQRVIDLFYTGQGNAAVKNTKWAAYNAVTEYVDHYAVIRKREGVFANEARMNSVIYGSGQDVKQKALELLSV